MTRYHTDNDYITYSKNYANVFRYNPNTGLVQSMYVKDLGLIEATTKHEGLGWFVILDFSDDIFRFTFLNSTLDIFDKMSIPATGYLGSISFSNNLLYYYTEGTYVSVNPLDKTMTNVYVADHTGKIINEHSVQLRTYTSEDNPLNFTNLFFSFLLIMVIIRRKIMN